ncbi:50S ribosomal protein L35 [Hydrogenimonas sp.]
MPKMKTVRGAAKRFKVKKSGKIKRGSAFRSHILSKMSQKRKRRLRSAHYVAEVDVPRIKLTLGMK